MVLRKLVNSKEKISEACNMLRPDVHRGYAIVVNRKTPKKLGFVLFFTFYFLLFTSPANAQVPIATPFATPFATSFAPPFQNLTDVGRIVSIVLSNAYIIAGIILLFLIALAGFGLISRSGSTDQRKITQGKDAITAAIIGFLIIFASYWIIQIMELITGVQIL